MDIARALKTAREWNRMGFGSHLHQFYTMRQVLDKEHKEELIGYLQGEQMWLKETIES